VRILFAVQDPHIPYLISGGPMDIHHLSLTLLTQGHEVNVVAALPGLPESVRIRQIPYRLRQSAHRTDLVVWHDSRNGYGTFRVGRWLVPQLLEERISSWRPDVVVVQGWDAGFLAITAVRQDVPVIMRYIDTAAPQQFADAIVNGNKQFESLLSNRLFMMVGSSSFVAGTVQEIFGVTSPVPVSYPLIRRDDHLFPATTAGYVTFVSPVPLKGLSIALGAAALLPERKFLFVEGWPMTRAARKDLLRAIAPLPNVTLRKSSVGLMDVYRSTAAVLLPSQMPEAFGRVIIEAGFHGIPAIASRMGGIPEALGESGRLLEASDSPERWASELARTLSDPQEYSRLSALAVANATRTEFSEQAIAARFVQIIDGHLSMASESHVSTLG
jgi:glycosyltransferase involved in cell wall biosynthesis